MIRRKFPALVLVLVLVLAAFVSPLGAEKAETEKRISYEDPFVADREITVQVFVDDIAADWPENFAETEVGKVLKERTGVDLKVIYRAADSDLALLNKLIMSDSLDTDVILAYLNNSARPEFPVLLKGAQDGLFADLSGILPETKVYSQYAEEGFLPKDSYKNIVYRDEFDGGVYLLHLRIPRYDESAIFNPEKDLVGGMYIQSAIVDELDIDPREVHTAEEFHDLLVKIRDGGFTDRNGQPVTPLGPKFWGGSVDAMDYFLRPFNWGVSDGYNMNEDGEILHEVETEYAMKKVEYVRQLLDEKLIHPEFFTMDSTNAEEVTRNLSVGIIGDVHNYVEAIYSNEDWLPLGPLNDYTGDPSSIASGKGGYGVMAISADAENPAEIMKFFDYLASYEGKLLGSYGVEGVSYEMNDEGMPRLTEEALTALNDRDRDYMVEKIGASFGGAGTYFFAFATTDVAGTQEFGEDRPGASSAEMFAGAVRAAEFAPKTFRYVPGLTATAYLNDPAMEEVKVQMSLLNYKEQLVDAFYESNLDDSKAILDNFKSQLESAGLDQLKEHITAIYEEDSEAINFY